MGIKDYIILALVAACAVLYLTRGCGQPNIGLVDCPEPKVIIQKEKVEGTVGKGAPIPAPKRETYRPMDIHVPVLVATVNEQPIYMQPADTAAIIKDWATKREYEFDRSDTSITATIKGVVQYNRLQDVQLKYEFIHVTHTSLYDRFQFHTLGSFGINSDFDRQHRVKLGLGGLMEFKTGTGTGLKYDHTIGAPLPHSVEVIISQRLSFRKRRP